VLRSCCELLLLPLAVVLVTGIVERRRPFTITARSIVVSASSLLAPRAATASLAPGPTTPSTPPRHARVARQRSVRSRCRWKLSLTKKYTTGFAQQLLQQRQPDNRSTALRNISSRTGVAR